MKYTFENKKGQEQTVDIPQSYIDNQISSLGIGTLEACKLYLSDEGYINDDTVATLTDKAKGNKPKVKRKKKKDPDKLFLVGEIYDWLLSDYWRTEDTVYEIQMVDDCRVVRFKYKDNTYEITLAKKRK